MGIQPVGIHGLQPGENRQRVFKILEAVFLCGSRVLFRDQPVDLVLDCFLAAGEGIQFGLREDQRLVGPSGRHELTDERNHQVASGRHGAVGMGVHPFLDRVNKVQIAIHLLVFDQGAAQDDLRNQDGRDNQDAGFAFRDQGGDDQSDRHAAARGQKHRDKDNPEPAPESQQRVADPREERALNDGKSGERQRLCQHVIDQAHVEISLPHEHRAVPDDIVHAIGESEKHRHDQG